MRDFAKSFIKLDLVLTVVSVAVGVAVSIAVSDARMELRIDAQQKRLDYNTAQRDEIRAQVSAINERTARMEGILEELRSRRK